MRTVLAACLVLASCVVCPAAAARSPGIPSPIRTIYVIPMSHLDIGFTDTPAAVAQLQKAILDSAIALADRNADYVWNVETLWQLEQWVSRSTPSEITHLIDVIHRGQIHLHACYVNLHSDALAEEETLRMFAFADSLRRAWNVTIETAVQDDVPGYNWAYPTAMKQSGVRHLVCGLNTGLGGGVTIPRSDWPFYWIGPEGDSVLTWVTNNNYLEATFTYGLWSVSSAFTKLSQLLPQWVVDGYPYDAIMVLAATGDNGEPSIAQTQVVRDWNATYDNPRLVMSTPDSFFAHLRAAYGDAHPAYRGTFGGFWDAGTIDTPHSLIAQRRAHDQARAAETFATLHAALFGAPYPKDTEYFAARQTLQYDDHNGGGAPWPNTLTRGQTRQQSLSIMSMAFAADSATALMRDDALGALAAQVVTPESAIVVFNATASARSGLVRVAVPQWATAAVVDRRTGAQVAASRDASAGTIAFVAPDVPGMGYSSFALRHAASPAPSASAQPSSDPSIENEFYRISVSSTDGTITSILDKIANRELVNSSPPYPFNGLIYASNLEALFETYHVAALGAATVSATDAPPVHTITVARVGSPMPAVVIQLVDGVNAITLTDTIDRTAMRHVPYNDSFDYYDITLPFALGGFTTYIDWQGRFGVPQVDNIPGAEIPYFVATHGGEMNEGAYGVRWASSDAMVWEWEKIRSYATTFAPQSASLLARILKKEDEAKYKNTGVGSLEVEPGQSASFAVTITLASHAGAFDPAGAHAFGTDAVTLLAARVVPPQLAGALSAPAASMIHTDTIAARILTMRPSADVPGAVLARIANPSASPVVAHLGSELFDVASAEQTSLVETHATPLAIDGRGVDVTLSPWQVTTVRLQLLPHATGIGDVAIAGGTSTRARVARDGSLRLSLDRSTIVGAALFDATGRCRIRYGARVVERGETTVQPDRGLCLTRGVYLLRLSLADRTETRRVVALR